MTEKPLYIKTGLAVLIGVTVFLFSILFFGGDRSLFKSYNYYRIIFDSTQGLNAGSIISLSGMEVGNIEEISFTPSHKLQVKAKIEKKYAPLITRNSLAAVRTQGALGDKYIFITLGEPSETSLSDGDEIAVDRQPDFLDLISGKTQEFDSLKEILFQLSTLLKNLNQNDNSAKLLGNVMNTSSSITSLVNEPSIKESFTLLKSILRKIDNGNGSLGLLINDPTVHQRIVKLLGESPRNSYLKPLLREAIRQNEQNKN